jgi:hypothetical protein
MGAIFQSAKVLRRFLFRNPHSEIRNREIKMEAVQQSIEGGHETRMTVTGFEPEILAFCCEH